MMNTKALKAFSKKAGLGAVAVMASAQSYAATDWSAVSGAVDLSGEQTAVIAIFGTLAAFAVVMLGGRKVLAAVGGNR